MYKIENKTKGVSSECNKLEFALNKELEIISQLLFFLV
jgi:hypothetical protein